MTNNTIKILPIGIPAIKYLTRTTSFLAISSTCQYNDNWIYSNYIQIDIKSNITCYFHDDPPFIHCKDIPKSLINNDWSSFSQFVINSININHYVFLRIDTYYIEAYINYKDYHHQHELLIYGYDLSKEIFYIADFFCYNKDFNMECCSFLSLDLAYSSFNKIYPGIDDDIHLLKLNNIKIEFNKEWLITEIENYILGKDRLNQKCFDNIAFGIDIYKQLIILLNSIEPNRNIIHTTYSILPKHKNFMIIRVNYLTKTGIIEENNILESLKELLNVCLSIQNLFIKYNLTFQQNILLKIERLLVIAREIDNRIMETLMRLLCK